MILQQLRKIQSGVSMITMGILTIVNSERPNCAIENHNITQDIKNAI